MHLHAPVDLQDFKAKKGISWFVMALGAGILYGCLPITLG